MLITDQIRYGINIYMARSDISVPYEASKPSHPVRLTHIVKALNKPPYRTQFPTFPEHLTAGNTRTTKFSGL